MSIAATFPNRAGEATPRIARLVDRVGEELAAPEDALTNLRIALDEVVTNILNYAYRDGASHDITIRCELEGGRLKTVVEDDGVAYDPLLAPDPDLGSPLDTRRLGGLGVHFVKSLMSDVRYERVGGRNRLTLVQDLQGKAPR
jgi:serine/threonine-protein kinase RsbW